ncbi:MAG TPA: 1-(5-phosphoribosyl)-5-[(5-phosphoribosylamino)methylideneamino]imidazole-4-carboxamide isomerase [Clostridiales bacterium]|nr:1-(5-phosphoribosyl)-5-[(5-phosphoribosylamino)methylideneamino]imidazole-4-carboxamide isomerase [Clostridiales bacterium]
MIIFPAIDIKGGRCVRLLQGRAEDETVYGNNPVETARIWEEQGAEFLHVVDLDGAFGGGSPNEEIIRNMAESVSIPIQLGGGIRSMDRIHRFLDEYGIRRVILGTAAVENTKLLEQAVKRYGNRIAAGIDARKGKAAIKGWVKETDLSAVELGLKMKEVGIDTIIYTDIAKDGMLEGPNLRETQEMIERTGLNIIASGGITSLPDLQQIRQIGAAGAIIGKALYTGAIELSGALRIGREAE